jgi:hypothetical protein
MILPLELIYQIYYHAHLVTKVKIDNIFNMKQKFNWDYISSFTPLKI